MRWRDLLSLQTNHPLPSDFFETPRRVHFIGAGGIGMSALALLLKARGHDVSGSDERDGAMPQKLRGAGVEVFIGHVAHNVEGAEAIFYSSAIPHDNPEWIAAIERNIPRYHRAQLLAHISNAAKVSIAVSGTHGKSTTSAMIAHILTETGHNPTAILGAVYPPFDSNLRIGDPDLVVVEADESDGSFTLLKPTVAVVLNVEPEHLENYDESEDELWRAFEMFCASAKIRNLCGNDDELTARIPHKHGTDAIYGIAHSMSEFWPWASEIELQSGKTTFLINGDHPAALTVPGAHNVSNALAAVAASMAVEMQNPPVECSDPPDAEEVEWLLDLVPSAAEHLESFAGTLRRFERKGETKGVLVYDDYGHHPTEVRATLGAAKEFLQRPIAVVFQPHRYSRTQALYREFGTAFDAADRVIITQLYSAHEAPIEGVSGRLVFDAVRENAPDKSVFYAANLDEALKLALENVQSGDALITMGAGDVTTLGPRVLEALQQV